VILPKYYLTKHVLKCLKSGFKYKKKDKNTDEDFLHHSEFEFFRVQLKFAFKIRASDFIELLSCRVER